MIIALMALLGSRAYANFQLEQLWVKAPGLFVFDPRAVLRPPIWVKHDGQWRAKLLARQLGELSSFDYNQSPVLTENDEVPQAPSSVSATQDFPLKRLPKLSHTLQRGERLRLTVEIDEDADQKPNIAWFFRKKWVCFTKECVIDSSILDPGKFEITMQLSYPDRALEVGFTINIPRTMLKRGKDIKDAELRPWQGKGVRISHDGRYSLLSQGRGFVKRRKGWSPISRRLEEVKGDETWRLSHNSLVRFGDSDESLHYLRGKALLETQRVTPYKNLMSLKHGQLRSRNMRNDFADFAISLGNGVMIDTGFYGDVWIEKKPSGSTRVVCLQGPCRIRSFQERSLFDISRNKWEIFWADKRMKPHVIMLNSGEFIGFHIGRVRKARLHQVESSLVSKLVTATTPQLFLPDTWQSIARQGRFYGPLLKEQVFKQSYVGQVLWKTESVSRWTDSIMEAYDHHHALRVWEHVGFGKRYVRPQVNRPIIKLMEASLLLGFQQQSAARKVLDTAGLAGEQKSIGLLLKSVSLLLEQRFDEAEEVLDQLLDAPGPVSVYLIHYYKGVAKTAQGSLGSGLNEFLKVVHESKDDLLVTAAGGFVDLHRKRLGWKGFATALILEDTQPVSVDASEPTFPEGNEWGASSIVFDLSTGLSWTAAPNRLARLGLGLVGGFEGYNNQVISTLARSHVKLFSRINLAIPLYQMSMKESDPAEKASGLLVSLEPYLGFNQIDSGQVQRFGLDLELGWGYSSWQPGFYMKSEQYLDPSPDSEKLLDPLTGEAATGTNRSGRLHVYGFSITPIHVPYSSNAQVRLYYRTQPRRSEGSMPDSFRGFGIESSLGYYLWWHTQMSADISYELREFAQHSESRKDTYLAFKGGASYQLRPDGFVLLELRYRNNSSSVAYRSYGGFAYGGGYSYRF